MTPDEATVVYSPSGTRGRSARQPKLLLLAGTDGRDTVELQTLLRTRLQLISILASIAAGLGVTQKLLSWNSWEWQHAAQSIWIWPDLRMGVFNILFFAVMAAFLTRNRFLSVRMLRTCEVLVFGDGLVTLCTNTWYVLNTGGWLAELLRLQHLNVLASALTLQWFMIIAGYGTLIPNTGRRCAIYVSAFAVTALLLNGVCLVINSVSTNDIVRYMMQMVVWLIMAMGIAIVGSHRLETLRREASAARQLGQYQLKQRLGAGGMGEVYLAEHVLLRRPCAVKLIRPERGSDPVDLQRFEREVRTTATLSHPNTVQVYDYGHADDGTFYYVMEYLSGQTLEQLVQREGPLPPARAIHFLKQLCGSLREAHANGLIHRDIKPGNVIICERGGIADVAKLLDFGLVRSMADNGDGERLTQDGGVSGTPAYMSPEQIGDPQSLDVRSDIYSLGAVGYFLLTGQSPFSGRPAVKMLAAHLYEAPVPLSQRCPDIPNELEAIILRCLSKNPSERHADVTSLCDALSACEIQIR